MKKLTIVIIAVVFLFGSVAISNVSARSPIPMLEGLPAEVQEALADIWSAIITLQGRVNSLQNQITNIQLIPGPVGPQGPAGQNLHLYDGADQDLGILVSADGNRYSTYVASTDIIAVFDQNNVGATPTLNAGSLRIHFSDSSCSGTPFIENVGPNQLYGTEAQTVGFVVPLVEIPTPRTANSHLLSNGNCNQTTPNFFGYTVHFQEVTLPFSLPLTWPLEIRSE